MSKNMAVSNFIKSLKTDKELRNTFKANIAMAHIDAERWYKERTGKKFLNKEDKHIIANEGAEYFLNLLCDELDCPNDTEK